MTRDYNMTLFAWRFEREFQAFVSRGGLDAPCRVDEDVERAYLLRGRRTEQPQCKHGMPEAYCVICNPIEGATD